MTTGQTPQEYSKKKLITKNEVVHVIKLQENGRATGSDEIHAEWDSTGLRMLTSLFSRIYNA